MLVTNFEKDTGLSNILPPEAKADSFLYHMFPEDLLDLIVNETNRNAILWQLSPNHGAISQLDFCLELIDELLGNYSCCKRKQALTKIEVRDGKSHFPVRVTLNRCSKLGMRFVCCNTVCRLL